jgi:SAM-dependent methyltransferase
MAAEVLQSSDQYKRSRAVMRKMGIDCRPPFILRIARHIGFVNGIEIGDYLKSWDVLKTITFIQDHLSPDSRILDIGAYASEVLCSLHRLRFTDLTGVDLNPELGEMPYAESIHYIISDFMHIPAEDCSFSAVTAISVIEHGFHGDALLQELSRVLKPGGFFIASVDYWPDKINTTSIQAFGMDWRIFSKDDLLELFASAKKYGFSPVGDINFSAGDPIISWQGKQYTFLWFALQKTNVV